MSGELSHHDTALLTVLENFDTIWLMSMAREAHFITYITLHTVSHQTMTLDTGHWTQDGITKFNVDRAFLPI